MYFVILFTLGTKVMTGLFTAILLSHFDDDGGEGDEEETVDEKKENKELPKENICKRMFKPENLKNSWNSFANNLMDTFGKGITVREERLIKLQEMID